MLDRLTILRAVVESILARGSAFPSVLLSDAVKYFTVEEAAIVMQILAAMLKGISSSTTSKEYFHLLGDFFDLHARRAIEWMEAIVDGHFTSLALQVVSNQSVYHAVLNAIKVSKDAQEAMENTTEVLGLSAHLHRILTRKGEHIQPVVGVYQLEQIVL